MIRKSWWVALLVVVGCATPSGNDGGTGGGTATGGSSGGGTGGGSAAPCALSASCVATDKTCVGLVDNSSGSTFALRVNSMHIVNPAALTTGIVSSIVGGNFVQNLTTCHQNGSGSANWLLNIDTTANTLTLGGALPVTDPTQGYTFFDQMVNGVAVAPVALDLSLTGSALSATGTTKVVLPIFLNDTGSQVLLIPLSAPEVRSGTLSSNRACIGSYNADGLSPADSCQPTGANPGFIAGAELDGYITLEDADAIFITAVNETLCVLLSGNASMYGTQVNGQTVCKRDSSSNQILFAGDWCSTSNTSTGCTDSVKFSGQFAAGSIAIH